MTNNRDFTQQALPRVLVSGASFAGLSTAYWMLKLGYQVTVVEIADGLRMGGTPVDIRDGTIDVVKRMGIFDAIRSSSLPPRLTQFKAADDTTQASLEPDAGGGDTGNGFEIERDVLLGILFKEIDGKVEIIFGNSITSLEESDDAVRVAFADGMEREFSLVFGCEGNHSATRTMHFCDEAAYSHFLGLYFSISIIDKLIVAPNTTQIFSVAGSTVMLNSYENKTDVVFCFHSDMEIAYDYRDKDQQRRIIEQRFSGLGWRVPALLDEVRNSHSFYFDKMCQIKMTSWTKGRVALVGDAAYCASPAAGMGGSLAIIGADALAQAFQRHPGDIASAFSHYHHSLAPFIAQAQADAVSFGLDTFVPRTEEAIRDRNARLRAQ